jgi:hypothetical protein
MFVVVNIETGDRKVFEDAMDVIVHLLGKAVAHYRIEVYQKVKEIVEINPVLNRVLDQLETIEKDLL